MWELGKSYNREQKLRLHAGRRCSSARLVAGRRTPALRPAIRTALQVAAEKDAPAEALEKRWEAQIKEGRVVNVSGKDVKTMLRDGWVLLDVRPPGETSKVPIIGAVEVPLFKEDTAISLGTFLAKWAHLGTGGWWLGGTHMVPNQNFLIDVQQKVPKDARVLVACQKGLRSLAACEQLARVGYTGGLAWINGGLDTCRKEDLDTKDGIDVRYAGIGGVSSLLGWTEVQQAESKELLGGVNGVLKLFAVILAADVLLFAYEYITAMQNGSL